MVDLDSVAVLAGLRQKMQYLSERQAVLAQNVANANTPNYKPLDLKPMDFGAQVAQASHHMEMAATKPGHMRSKGGSSSRFETVVDKDTAETTPSGNAVVLEEQMMKMSKTATDYQTTTALYRKMTSLFTIAINGNP